MPEKVLYYTVRDVVDHYEVSDKTVWRWIKERSILARRRRIEGERRKLWCVSVDEFNKIPSLMARNEDRLPVSLRNKNAERSAEYRSKRGI